MCKGCVRSRGIHIGKSGKEGEKKTIKFLIKLFRKHEDVIHVFMLLVRTGLRNKDGFCRHFGLGRHFWTPSGFFFFVL